jgi:hypothetical protein
MIIWVSVVSMQALKRKAKKKKKKKAKFNWHSNLHSVWDLTNQIQAVLLL